MKENIQKIEVPEGVTLDVKGNTIVAKSTLGEVRRVVNDPQLSFKLDGSRLTISAYGSTKREFKKVRTWRAHILNMMRGAAEGHVYRLKICSGHFPMNVSVSDSKFSVKNFLGEKVPRTVAIKDGAKVTVEGDVVTVESASKELAGQTAADIELLCVVRGRDRRIFQDGIWITEKDGRVIK